MPNAIKARIARSVVTRLGYTDNQWCAINHGRNDPGHDWKHQHDHLHIVVNAIAIDGNRTTDAWEKRRFETILRQLEVEENLTRVPSSRERFCKAASTGQIQRYKKESSQYRLGVRSDPPDPPLVIKLQAAITLL